jgi:hypothetical protein
MNLPMNWINLVCTSTLVEIVEAHRMLDAPMKVHAISIQMLGVTTGHVFLSRPFMIVKECAQSMLMGTGCAMMWMSASGPMTCAVYAMVMAPCVLAAPIRHHAPMR